MEFEKDFCPVVKVDGFIEKGKQFDLEINLPEDNRNVIYGVIKDCYKDAKEFKYEINYTRYRHDFCRFFKAIYPRSSL